MHTHNWLGTCSRKPIQSYNPDTIEAMNEGPVSCVVISISDRVCVPLCVCVYFILVFLPPLRVVVCE
jgi:hypothetical protein